MVTQMGLKHKKEKTPEKTLVDEIWQEINLMLSVMSEKGALLKIVEKAYKEGASCEEIRRVYEENLPNYQRKADAEIERQKAVGSEPLTLKDKLKAFGIIAVIVIMIIGLVYLIFFMPRELSYEEISVGGLTFNIPQGYVLTDLGEDSVSAYQKYEDVPARHDSKKYNTPTYYLEIYVFYDTTVEQVIFEQKFDDDWKIERDIAYGKYVGVRVDVIVQPFGNTSPQWYIFEKDGKTVALNLDNEAVFKHGIEKIIN